jgi:predicted neutral ceramidase superfamily lipid hydrolase
MQGRPDPQDDSLPVLPVIRVAPLGEIKIYQILEGELDRLANGPPESIYLNFALTLLPVSFTLLVTLLTTTIRSSRLYQSFVLIAAVTLIIGVILLILWARNRSSTRRLIEDIRNRMPPPPSLQDNPSHPD